MIHQTCSAVLIASISGSVLGNEPVLLEPDSGQVRHAGHMYFNVSTGERIMTLIDAVDMQQPASFEQLQDVWVSTTRAPCAEFGYDTELYLDINVNTSITSQDNNYYLLDWGEMPANTVVDCVQVHWITDLEDNDANSDGQPDGVEGFTGKWIFWDAVSRNFASTSGCFALSLIEFRLDNLPGHYPPSEEGATKWTADIDLGADLQSSMIFEIGDTDSILDGADVHNQRLDLVDNDSDGNPDFDANGNGLADWGWSVYFTEPGTVDIDNADGDSDSQTGIDGTFVPESIMAVQMATPTPGHAEYIPDDDRWIWVPGESFIRSEDSFILMNPQHPSGSGALEIAGLYYFGGFDCSPEGQEMYTPFAQFELVMYTPFRQFDCADINGDHVLDFFDISFFLEIRYDYNGDDVFDFFDISSYLADFAIGCP